jgi:tetratricopeptide (TPR) repeat protein
LKFPKRCYPVLTKKNIKKMKKTLLEAYTEGLLSENAEDALLESYFEQKKKKQFNEKVQQAVTQHTAILHLQRRLSIYRWVAVFAGGILLTGGYIWMQPKPAIAKITIPPPISDKSIAFYLEKTADPAYKPRISNVLMSAHQTPDPIPKAVQTDFEQGHYAEAVKGLENLKQKDAAIWSYIGFCYMQITLDDKALAAFKQSTKTDKNFSGQQNIVWWTILIYCRQNKFSQAKGLLESLPEDHYARQEKWVENLLEKIAKMK